MFNSSGTGLAGAKYGWLAFENNSIVGKIGIWGHIGILSLMTIAFIIFEFYNNRYTFCDFVKGKTIWIELLVIQSALAFVPVFIMNTIQIAYTTTAITEIYLT